MPTIPNILADRYASSAMVSIWSPEGKVVLERELWIAVLRAQADLGLDVPAGAVEAYEKVKQSVNLEAIRDREAVTRHDVKARIDEFCALAGFEAIHRGMTSRDLTENVEQLQVRRALELVRERAAAALNRLAALATRWEGVVITARTHNVPAQPTTFGKRIATYGEELLDAFQHLNRVIETLPLRGIKGAVGTQLDLTTLFGGDASRVLELEERIRVHLGFGRSLGSVGQVYPRSLDHRVLSALLEIASGPGNLCRSLRLMAGHETASEGFAPGQTGSSAMPHKMNSRSCERVNGFQVLLRGYAAMASGLAGDQWHEGDVSCSVVRRVALPDAFLALDGLFETFLTVLDQMEIYPAVISRENEAYFPFLSTTTLLMAAVRRGAGRESAHEAIKEHAVATVRELREGRLTHNDLAAKLADDQRLGLKREEIDEVISSAAALTGAAAAQVRQFAKAVAGAISTISPEAIQYQPGSIL